MFESSDPRVRHVHHLPAREGRTVPWPEWVDPGLTAAWADHGVPAPWVHQAEAMEAAHAGRHVLLTTGTASGKSAAYLTPLAQATWQDQGTALYIAPTKALAHDQLRVTGELGLDGWRVSALDGDADQAERRWARQHARLVLTNPDMLHYAVLPHHSRWVRLLRGLRYIVIDECHRYRGVFGAHVSAIIRRLRRLAAMYGAHPVVVATSATSGGGARTLADLAGVDEADVTVVDEDASPHGAVDMVMWQPLSHHDIEAGELLADCVLEGRQTVAFVASRAMAEKVAVQAQETLGPAGRVDAYRAGYLHTDRRRLERQLQTGELNGVAATNALELGVDIAGLDAVIVSGYPGTRAALWQQAGRAGRRGEDALVFLVARENPLDAYFMAHPAELLDGHVEQSVLDPANPYVLGPHLAAAAQEAHLVPEDAAWFGPQMVGLADRLAAQGVLRRRRQGWFWTRPERAASAIDIRGSGARSVDIIDVGSGRVIGMADLASADRAVHPEAVYLHQGDAWLVESLDLERYEALVRRERPGYTTQPVVTSDIRVLSTTAERPMGAITVGTGMVELTSQVTGYLRRDELDGSVWDQSPMVMPEHRMQTSAMWLRIGADVVERTGLDAVALAGAVHAAEHTAIGLLPMFASCDRWDIGGVSTVFHPDTGAATIFVHDGQAGGSGYAARGYEVAEAWWAATLERLETCPCSDGCPACIHSPKCGNANQSLDKDAARRLLVRALARVSA